MMALQRKFNKEELPFRKRRPNTNLNCNQGYRVKADAKVGCKGGARKSPQPVTMASTLRNISNTC
jgi:hypothetical protein